MKAVSQAPHKSIDVKFNVSSGSEEYSDRSHKDVQRFREQILEALNELREGGILHVSLGRARLSSSCFDESVGKGIRKVARGSLNSLPHHHVVTIDPTGENWWDADAALRKASEAERLKLVCLWRGRDDDTTLVGPVDEQSKSTYEFVSKRGSTGATTRVLAQSQDISIQAASNRMSRTAKLGIIRRVKRESAEGGGTQYVYVAVS
jgi:hypothetical protein